jgi:hypothetical protein
MNWILRMAALMGAGAYGVHQLRFALTPANRATAHAHAYLAPVGTVLVGLLLLALAAALARIARGHVDATPRLRRLWPGTIASLVAVYCAQESIERLIAHGESPLARGGWVAIPLAVVIGFAVALIARGAAVASEVAAAERQAPALAIDLTWLDVLLRPWSPRRVRPAARPEAARGPPLACV